MKRRLLNITISAVCLSVALAGCARATLSKAAFVPSELKGGKSISVIPFSMAAIPKFDGEAAADPGQEIASLLGEFLGELGLFGRIEVTKANERVVSDLIVEGAFVIFDDGERGSFWVEMFSKQRSPENHSAIAVNLRIVASATGAIVYAVGPIGAHAYRPALGPTISTIRSGNLKAIAKRVADDLKAELK